MKKTALTLGSLVFLFVMFVSPVLALELEVDHDGNIKMYEGYVLGETTDKVAGEKFNPKEGTRPVKTPSRMIDNREDKDVVVTMEDKGTKVELRDSMTKSAPSADVLMSDNLEMKFPAKYQELTEEQKEKMNEYQEKIMEARQERVKELAELRERKMGEEKALELKSRNVKAHLNGAEFVLDTENNEVKLTTPSGNEHTLTHLPDQALARMKEAGVLTDGQFNEENDELEAVATDDGIEYSATVKEERKFLSFFPRMVERKVTLDDATGEVASDYTSQGWFARMMDRFSY